MLKIRKLQGENVTTFINLLSLIVLSGISIFTAPIFTRLLGPSQYSLVAMCSSWVSILACFISFGVGNAMAPGIYRFQEEYLDFRNSVLLLGTSISSIVILLGMLAIEPLSKLLDFTTAVVVCIFFQSISGSLLSTIQLIYIFEKKPLQNFVVSIIVTVSTIIVSFWLIFSFDPENRYLARIIGITLPQVAMAFILFAIMFKEKPIGIKKEYACYALSIGIPSVFHLLSGMVLSVSDRIMMKYMNVSSDEIGIYSAFYAFSSILLTILQAFNKSWEPFYYDCLAEGNWNKTKRKSNNYIELFSIMTSGFILLSREFGILFTGSEYISGIRIIPILVGGIYFVFMYQFYVNYELFYSKSNIVAIGTFATALINIGFNLLLIPSFGMYGAAIATLASYLLLLVAHYLIASNLKPNRCRIKISIFLPGCILVFCSSLMYFVCADYWYLRWGLAISIGVYELIRILNRKSIF